MDLDFYLTGAGEQIILSWVELRVGKALTTHCSAFKSCKKFLKYVLPDIMLCLCIPLTSIDRVPAFPFSEKMRLKSNSMVLAVSPDDPSTSFGATNVLTNLKKYVPEGGEGKLRVAVNGDQAFVARCRQSVDCKSDEDSEQNLNCFLPLAQDFHAQMVSICSMKKIDYEYKLRRLTIRNILGESLYLEE